MNCKELNIELCYHCRAPDSGPLRICLIDIDMRSIKTKASFNHLLRYYKSIKKNQPQTLWYFEKALEIENPEWFEKLNKIMVLI